MNIFKRFYNDYICVRLSDYRGFDSDLQINKLLFFVFLGLTAACIIITLRNSAASLLLKKLTRAGAFGEEKSKHLADLGLGDSRAVKWLLRHKSGSLKTLIATKGTSSLTYEEYTELEKAKKRLRTLSKDERKVKLHEIEEQLSPTLNFNEAEFYIPTDMQDASERFISEKSTTLTKGLIYCGIILAFYLLIALLMPTLLSWISGIISK